MGITGTSTFSFFFFLDALAFDFCFVFENINEAKDMLILQGENCRLVIMETGSGKFTGTATRREIGSLRLQEDLLPLL